MIITKIPYLSVNVKNPLLIIGKKIAGNCSPTFPKV